MQLVTAMNAKLSQILRQRGAIARSFRGDRPVSDYHASASIYARSRLIRMKYPDYRSGKLRTIRIHPAMSVRYFTAKKYSDQDPPR